MSTVAQKEARSVGPLVERQRKLDNAKAYRAQLRAHETDMLSLREGLPKTPNEKLRAREAGLAPEQERIRASTAHTLHQLYHGVDMRVGVAHDFMEAYDGKPGLVKLEELIMRLEKEIAVLQADEDKWAHGPRKMRFVGKSGKYMWREADGTSRYLEYFEEVLVSRERYANTMDQWEDVEPPIAVG